MRPSRTHAVAHPPRGREWHGLDVFNCSATAQRGALTGTEIQEGRAAGVQALYARVRNGKECARVLPPAAPATTRRSWQRNWVKSTIPKCGAPVLLPARCVPSNLTRSSPKHQGRLGPHGKLKSATNLKAAGAIQRLFCFNIGGASSTSPKFLGHFSQGLADLITPNDSTAQRSRIAHVALVEIHVSFR